MKWFCNIFALLLQRKNQSFETYNGKRKSRSDRQRAELGEVYHPRIVPDPCLCGVNKGSSHTPGRDVAAVGIAFMTSPLTVMTSS